MKAGTFDPEHGVVELLDATAASAVARWLGLEHGADPLMGLATELVVSRAGGTRRAATVSDQAVMESAFDGPDDDAPSAAPSNEGA